MSFPVTPYPDNTFPTPQAYRKRGLHMPLKEIQLDAMVYSETKKLLPASIYKNPTFAKNKVNTASMIIMLIDLLLLSGDSLCV